MCVDRKMVVSLVDEFSENIEDSPEQPVDRVHWSVRPERGLPAREGALDQSDLLAHPLE